jgi:hypothetical protein
MTEHQYLPVDHPGYPPCPWPRTIRRSMVAWTPAYAKDNPTAGQVEVGPWPDPYRNGWSNRYASTDGACMVPDARCREMEWVARVAPLPGRQGCAKLGRSHSRSRTPARPPGERPRPAPGGPSLSGGSTAAAAAARLGCSRRADECKLHLIRQLGQHRADEGGKIWRRVAGHGRVWRSLGERVVCPATRNERSGRGGGGWSRPGPPAASAGGGSELKDIGSLGQTLRQAPGVEAVAGLAFMVGPKVGN